MAFAFQLHFHTFAKQQRPSQLSLNDERLQNKIVYVIKCNAIVAVMGQYVLSKR